MTSPKAVVAAIAGLLLLLAPPLRAQTRPHFVFDLGTFGGTTSHATAINATGQIAGFSFLREDQAQNAFLIGGGGSAPRNLGTLGGNHSYAYAINASGRVAGAANIASGAFHAFLSTGNGGPITDLGTLGGTNSYAYGVDNIGRVVGYSQTPGNGATHAFISAPNGGALRSLGTLAPNTNSFAFAINNSGQVTGNSGTSSGFNHAFISGVNGGALRDLGTLGGRFSFGLALNNYGQVTGRSETASGQTHAFLSGVNGGPLQDLGTLGGFSSFGQAVNDLGWVTGSSFLSDNSSQRAFLYTAASGMIDLNTLLPVSSGWILTEGRGINENGQIVGVGVIDGQTHGFLLTPQSLSNPVGGIGHITVVPEPGAVLLLLGGAGLLALPASPRKTRRRSETVTWSRGGAGGFIQDLLKKIDRFFAAGHSGRA
jgi:probable HAF family extracellular repeat protein